MSKLDGAYVIGVFKALINRSHAPVWECKQGYSASTAEAASSPFQRPHRNDKISPA